MKKYQNLEHTADLKIRAFGKTKEDVFSNMAVGMFENICDKKAILKDQPVKREIKVKANDLPGLLVEFLNELVTLGDINDEVYLKYEVRSIKDEIKGRVYGYKVKGLKMEVKAVTYNELKIKEINGKWVAEVVFDI
jgi:SHS2 domain-containing protein